MRIETDQIPSDHRPSGLRRGTNQTGVRLYNERLVLSLIRQHHSLPQANLARLTGLSPPTVSEIVRRLEADGLLRKEAPQRGRIGQPSVPLSLNPDAAPASRAPTRVASSAPTSLAAAPSANPAHAAKGGYAVQVTSQRSEAEAQAAFRSLQGKYAGQLGGKAMFIHKVELGAKGTYYRAMVGPFATQAEASQLCSGLKSAGGSCLVQRN